MTLRTRFVLGAALVVGALVLGLAPAVPAQQLPRILPIWQKNLPGGLVRESSPLVADIDGVAGNEIVVGAWDKKVHVLRATTGAVVPGWPQATTHGINSSASVADVDGDKVPDLFIGSGMETGERAGALYSFTGKGKLRFRRALPDPDYPKGAPVRTTPALGDLNRDGVADVVAGTLGVRSLWALNARNATSLTGRELFYWDDSMFSSPALHDVNGDKALDVIVGGDSTLGPPVHHRGGMVRAVDSKGRSLWEFRINDIVRSSPAVGDIDGDGRPEVVFGAGDYYHGSQALNVFAVDAATGRKKWERATDGVTNSSPALADINGDGRLDVAIGTFNAPSHGKRGGTVYALDGRTGRDLAGFPRASGGGSILGGITTADVNGDGGQDLFVPTGAYIAVFSGRTGQKLFNLAEAQRVAFQNSPTIADLDGNGRLDVVAAGGHVDGHGVVYRWELPAQAKLGNLGWHQFRRDVRRTGSWTVR